MRGYELMRDVYHERGNRPPRGRAWPRMEKREHDNRSYHIYISSWKGRMKKIPRTPRIRLVSGGLGIERGFINAYKPWRLPEDNKLFNLLIGKTHESIQSLAKRLKRSQSALITRAIVRYGCSWDQGGLHNIMGRKIRRYDTDCVI